MIRIYCQYTIAGFKIFNLYAFPHLMPEGRYVRMDDISKGIEGEKQDIFVTREYHCDLDRRIMNLFSMNDVSLLILHHCGSKSDETYLYINDNRTQTSYAFSSNDKNDIDVFFRIASVWNSSKKEELIKRLQNLVGKTVIADEQVFAFYENKWNELCNDLKFVDIKFDRFRSLHNSNKNILVYLSTNKKEIINNAGIDLPLSSFITIPGNQRLIDIERRKRLIVYAVTGIGLAILIGSVFSYIANK